MRHWLVLAVCSFSITWGAFVVSDDAATVDSTAPEAVVVEEATAEVAPAETTPEAEELAAIVARVDALIAERWEADHIVPAGESGDAEFLRRTYLDIVGTIPSVSEAREFLNDQNPDKRRLLVERLLNDPRYVVHFTNVWKHVLIPEVEADFNFIYFAPMFESWLRVQLIENRPYNEMVYEILTTSLDGQSLYVDVNSAVNPAAYFQAKETKPENLAAATARMFLGTRIECAQCHNHPFDSWTREDFWSYAAFFANLQREAGQPGFVAAISEFFGSRKLQIPDTDQYVGPRFLGDDEPATVEGSPRTVLANWMTSDDNKLFAQTLVNRMWAHFLGTGIVDPVDDFTEVNPASHPELLDYLAGQFVAHDYDLKFLMQVITSTRAYRLSSEITDTSQTYARRYAVMPLRGLTKDQLLASFGEAVGRFTPFDISNPYIVFNDATPEGDFREMFGEQDENATHRQTSILQSLLMMNGQLTADATNLQNGQTLASIINYPDFNTGDRVEAVFLAALTRLPSEEEREQFIAYVESGGVEGSQDSALSDVFWVLLNSAEFRFNH